MSFKADVFTFDGKLMFSEVQVTEQVGPGGQLYGYLVNIPSNDKTKVDRIDLKFPPNAPIYFRILSD